MSTNETPTLTRAAMSTKRADARMWAALTFKRLVDELRALEPSAEAREVYRGELCAFLRNARETVADTKAGA